MFDNEHHSWNAVGPSRTSQFTSAYRLGKVNSRFKGGVSDSNLVHFLSNSVNILSRSASCPLWAEKKIQCLCANIVAPHNSIPANQQRGNQLHSNLCLFFCFCQLLSLFHVLALNDITGITLPTWYKKKISIVTAVLTFFPLQLHVFTCVRLLIEA